MYFFLSIDLLFVIFIKNLVKIATFLFVFSPITEQKERTAALFRARAVLSTHTYSQIIYPCEGYIHIHIILS